MAYRRQEAYQRLEAADAYRLRLAGHGLAYIAGRAATSTHLVQRWLKEVAAIHADPAVTTAENLRSADAGVELG